MIQRTHRWLEEAYPTTPLSLALLRILIALYVLLFVLPIGPHLTDLHPSSFDRPPGVGTLFSGFPSPGWLIAANTVLGSLAFLLMIGFKTRFVSIALTIVWVVLNARLYSASKIDHTILAVILPAAFAFSDWGSRLSVDASRYARLSPEQVARARLWSNRCAALFAICVGIAMFTAGLAKATSGWLDTTDSATLGHAFIRIHFGDQDALLFEPARRLLSPALWEAMDWVTVFFELAFLPAVLHRRVFEAMLCAAVAFHTGVWLMLDIVFHYNLIAYAAFVPLAQLIPRRGDLPSLTAAFDSPSTRGWVVSAGLALIAACTAAAVLTLAPPIETLPPAAMALIVLVPANLIAGGWLVIRLCRLLGASAASPKPELAAAGPGQPALDPAEHPILFFDGVCGLCNSAVDFVIARDRDRRFRYAMLQGDLARTRLVGLNHDAPPDSLVLLDEAGVHDYSSAALRTAAKLPAPWSWSAIFLLVPYPLRDAVYRLVAKHRYRFFGEKDACRMPTPEERALFVM